MTEEDWLTCGEPLDMLCPTKGWRPLMDKPPGPVGCHPAVSSDRKLRLYACGVFRLTFPELRYAADRRMLETAESFADGCATETDLADAKTRCGDTLSRLAMQSGMDLARGVYVSQPARIEHPAGRQTPLTETARCDLLRDIFGNPFRPVALDPSWLTPTAVRLAETIYDERAFDRLPILADALQDAGCEDADVLGHCRSAGPHVRGCWVVDLVLGKG